MMRVIAPLVLCSMILVVSVTGSRAGAPKRSDHPALIAWLDVLDVALAQSQTSGKPVLAILQDTPHCANCQSFQRDVATHPLLTEAIADEFIALKLDRRQYQGPATDSRRLLFLNTAGQPLIPSSVQAESPNDIASRMIQALKASQRPVPNYLHAASMELDTAQHKQAAFAMLCYWVGEYELGKIDGVVATEAGWIEGREVTLVRYHQDQLTLLDLARKAAEVKCARKVFAPTESEQREISASTRLTVGALDERYRIAKQSDQKKQIQHWNLAGVSDLTPMQLTKMNALAPDDPKRALEWLSARQRRGLTSPLADYASTH